ncbi:MAG: S8 family serine peptidase [Planctomycetota bacterium]|nr:S8 family serine peptidase [Planctomycetota bacterium]MDA1105688.1 S8 family serine peptidase [Planctomycetota bacterium]
MEQQPKTSRNQAYRASHWWTGAVAASLPLVGFVAADAGAQQPQVQAATLLVKVQQGATWSAVGAKAGVERHWIPAGCDGATAQACRWAKLGSPTPLYRAGVGADANSAALAAQLGLDRWYRVPIGNGEDPRILAALLQALGGAFEVVEADPMGELATDDPIWPAQWNMENNGTTGGIAGADISAPEAWVYAPHGGDGIVVAVLDSGVAAHADLAGRILPGWNVPAQNTNTSDICSSHGTHVCGTIAAASNNQVAMAGLAGQALILPVVIVNPCTGSESWVAEGIVWAADHGADLINMSLQYSVGSQVLHDAVLYADGLGIPMIASTGNNALTQPAFPARWPETIATSATDKWDEVWALSNSGTEVDIAAPGVAIDSLYGTSGTSLRTGTSMAASHVSGTVALILGEVPTLSTPLIRVALEGTATDIEIPGFDTLSGSGRLNAGAAVLAAITLGPGPGDVNRDGVINGADLALVLGAWGVCGCPCPVDTNNDCAIDGMDLAAVLGGWSSD